MSRRLPSLFIISPFSVIIFRISSKVGRDLGLLLVHFSMISLKIGCGISSGMSSWSERGYFVFLVEAHQPCYLRQRESLVRDFPGEQLDEDDSEGIHVG